MSCIGLFITLKSAIIVSISIDCKYSPELSLYTGIPSSDISFSYTFATPVILLNNIHMSLYWISLLPCFLSITWYFESIKSFIFLATSLASKTTSSTRSFSGSSSVFSSVFSSFFQVSSSSSDKSIISTSVFKFWLSIFSKLAPRFKYSSWLYSILPKFLLIIFSNTKFVKSNIFFLLLKFLNNCIFLSSFSFGSKEYFVYLSKNSSGLACLNLYILCFTSPTIKILFPLETLVKMYSCTKLLSWYSSMAISSNWFWYFFAISVVSIFPFSSLTSIFKARCSISLKSIIFFSLFLA